MKRIFCFLLTIVMIFSLCACKKDIDSEKPTEPSISETTPIQATNEEQVLAIVSSVVAPWTQYTEDEQLLYEELYESNFSEDEKAQNVMLENQALNTSIVVESCKENIAVLKITSPDLGKLLLDIVEKSNLEYGEDSVTKIKQLIADALANGEYTTTEYVVEVEYELLEDGSIDILETEEYYNALYGDLVAVQAEMLKQLEEGEQ